MELKVEFKEIKTFFDLKALEYEILTKSKTLNGLLTRTFLEVDYELNVRLYISDGNLYAALVKIPLITIKEENGFLIHLTLNYDNAHDYLDYLFKI